MRLLTWYNLHLCALCRIAQYCSSPPHPSDAKMGTVAETAQRDLLGLCYMLAQFCGDSYYRNRFGKGARIWQPLLFPDPNPLTPNPIHPSPAPVASPFCPPLLVILFHLPPPYSTFPAILPGSAGNNDDHLAHGRRFQPSCHHLGSRCLYTPLEYFLQLP